MTNLYSYDYEAKTETDEDNDVEIHFMIANEGLDGDKEEDSEVVKPKVTRKSQKICESSESDCEDSEGTITKFKKSVGWTFDSLELNISYIVLVIETKSSFLKLHL